MGKAIEKIALERGHQISFRIDLENMHLLNQVSPENTDVAIEFSTPESAFSNISACILQSVPVVAGTTGWLSEFKHVQELVRKSNGTFLYASNFSLGVNVFFKLASLLGKLTKDRGYEVDIEEIHHIHKVDKPSGTAISLAEEIVKSDPSKKGWKHSDNSGEGINITSQRTGEVPGTHIVKFRSEVDQVSIAHEAYSREGFALGAILVAEWIRDQKGVLTMDDFLNL